MSVPGKYNLVVYQGESFSKRFVWRGKNRRPINLTGYTAKMQVRESEDAVAELELTTENGGITLTSGGVIDLVITPQQTGALTFEPAIYDIFLFAPDGTVIPILRGKFTATKAVTK